MLRPPVLAPKEAISGLLGTILLHTHSHPGATRRSTAPLVSRTVTFSFSHVGAWARGSPSPALATRSCFPSTSTHLRRPAFERHRDPLYGEVAKNGTLHRTLIGRWSNGGFMAIKLPTVPPSQLSYLALLSFSIYLLPVLPSIYTSQSLVPSSQLSTCLRRLCTQPLVPLEAT